MLQSLMFLYRNVTLLKLTDTLHFNAHFLDSVKCAIQLYFACCNFVVVA